MVTVGTLAFLAELLIVMSPLRRARTGPRTSARSSEPRLSSMAIVVALLLPAHVVGLVSGGRILMIQQLAGHWTPDWAFWEEMRDPSNQLKVLLAGICLSLPSLMLASIVVASLPTLSCASRTRRILLQGTLATALGAFLSGAIVFLYRMLDLQGSVGLSTAKHALNVGAGLALLAMAAYGFCAARAFIANVLSANRSSAWNVIVGMGMLATATILGWLTHPMAAENHAAIPEHHGKSTHRVIPAIPPHLSQNELYETADKTRVGCCPPTTVPFIGEASEPLGRGALLQLSNDRMTLEGRWIDGLQDLQEQLKQAGRNAPLLYPNGTPPTLLLAAPPALAPARLAEVLHVVYQLGGREVRLVTGHPETVDRPVLGRLSRIALQATTVVLRRADDVAARKGPSMIPVPGQFLRYRDLLDRVREQASSTPTLLLEDSDRE